MNLESRPRLRVADLAKGAAILLMIQVHLTEVFAQSSVYNSIAGKVSLFLGGPLVAPFFIGAMGYFMAASTRSRTSLLMRGIKLLGLAVLLNLGLNAHLLIRIALGKMNVNPWQYLFGVDILFVASFAIIILALLRPLLARSPWIPLVMAGVMALSAPYLADCCTSQGWQKYLLAFIAGDYWWSYFPIFPWLAYPLVGYALYAVVKKGRIGAMSQRSKWILLITLAALLLVTAPYGVRTSYTLHEYYRHGFPFFTWTLLLSVVWLTLLAWMDRMWGATPPMRYLSWLGRNVTLVYVVQWLLIGNIGTAIYKTQPLWMLAVWFVAILTVTSITTRLGERVKRKPSITVME